MQFLKRKTVLIPFTIILFLVIIVSAPKVAGTIIVLGAIGGGVYLCSKGSVCMLNNFTVGGDTMKDIFKNFFNNKVKGNLKTAVMSFGLMASVMGNGYLYESSKLNVPKAIQVSVSSESYQKQIDGLKNENSKLEAQIKDITSKYQTQSKLISIQEENKNLSAKLSETQNQKSQEENGSSSDSDKVAPVKNTTPAKKAAPIQTKKVAPVKNTTLAKKVVPVQTKKAAPVKNTTLAKKVVPVQTKKVASVKNTTLAKKVAPIQTKKLR